VDSIVIYDDIDDNLKNI